MSVDFTGFTIKVARFDASYPAEDPDSFVVGFTVTSDANGRSMFQDVRLPYTETVSKNEQEVVSMAWDRVKEGFANFVTSVSSKGAILGSVFTPSTSA